MIDPKELKPSAEQLAQLKAEHGTIYVFEKNDYTFVLRKPKGKEYGNLWDALRDTEVSRYDTLYNASLKFTVYPPQQALIEIIDEFGGFAEEIGSEIMALCKNSAKAESKKG